MDTLAIKGVRPKLLHTTFLNFSWPTFTLDLYITLPYTRYFCIPNSDSSSHSFELFQKIFAISFPHFNTCAALYIQTNKVIISTILFPRYSLRSFTTPETSQSLIASAFILERVYNIPFQPQSRLPRWHKAGPRPPSITYLLPLETTYLQ